MRLTLFALLVLGALALAVVLLAWLAERRLDQTAKAQSFSDVAAEEQRHATSKKDVEGDPGE